MFYTTAFKPPKEGIFLGRMVLVSSEEALKISAKKLMVPKHPSKTLYVVFYLKSLPNWVAEWTVYIVKFERYSVTFMTYAHLQNDTFGLYSDIISFYKQSRSATCLIFSLFSFCDT